MRSLALCLLYLALIAGVVCFPAISSACTCSTVTPLEQLERSDAVFTGTVVSVDVFTDQAGNQIRLAQLVMHDIWKGPDRTEYFVETRQAGSCSFAMSVDTEYLVYATVDPAANAIYLTHECNRTRPSSQAQADIDELGTPRNVLPTESATWGRIKALFD